MEIKSKLNDQEVTIEVRKPTPEDNMRNRLFRGVLFKNIASMEDPPPLREKLNEYLIKLGKWSEAKDKELSEINKKIQHGERQLALGGKTKDGEKFTKAQAKELAINMRIWRLQQIALLVQFRSNDQYTIEGMIEQAGFEDLVARCSTLNGENIFKDRDDYLKRSEEQISYDCAQAMSEILYTKNDDKMPEDEFLKKYGFTNDKGELVDKDGNLVDENGKRIDENGNYLNENGESVDSEGNRIDKDGRPIETFTEYEE